VTGGRGEPLAFCGVGPAVTALDADPDEDAVLAADVSEALLDGDRLAALACADVLQPDVHQHPARTAALPALLGELLDVLGEVGPPVDENAGNR
jgi:hypothetical protein